MIFLVYRLIGIKKNRRHHIITFLIKEKTEDHYLKKDNRYWGLISFCELGMRPERSGKSEDAASIVAIVASLRDAVWGCTLYPTLRLMACVGLLRFSLSEAVEVWACTLSPSLRLAACMEFLQDVAWSWQRKPTSFALAFATLL
jgi:hypothetical protein